MIAFKTRKYLRINLTREAKDLYTENSKILLKEIKDLKKWKDNPYAWIRRLIIVKTEILLKLVHRFNAVPIKNRYFLLAFFTETENFCKKFHMEIHRTKKSQNNNEKEQS
jgi:hypothetical protein